MQNIISQSGVIGKLVQLPRNTCRYRDNKYDELKEKVLFKFPESVNYIESLIKKYPRYAKDKLRIMENCICKYNKAELVNALDYCDSKELISANDFRDTLEFFRTDEPKIIPEKIYLPDFFSTS